MGGSWIGRDEINNDGNSIVYEPYNLTLVSSVVFP